MQIELENLDFVQGVCFEFIDSTKDNGTKYLLIFEGSWKKICTSKRFFDVAAAGRFCWFYVRRQLFHQIKLGRDFDFQN